MSFHASTEENILQIVSLREQILYFAAAINHPVICRLRHFNCYLGQSFAQANSFHALPRLFIAESMRAKIEKYVVTMRDQIEKVKISTL